MCQKEKRRFYEKTFEKQNIINLLEKIVERAYLIYETVSSTMFQHET